MTYATYGSHRHDTNEVNLVRMDVRQVRSKRGRRLFRDITLYLYGELQATGATLLSDIAELIDAYSRDDLEFRYYMDDGTLTRHSLLLNQGCVSGIKVLQRSWPRGDAAELAVKRAFSITLWARYLDTQDQVVHWSERVRTIGNCGPRFEIVETVDGPIAFQTAKSTAQRIIQSGEAIGLQGYVEPPGPLWPIIEHQDQREVELTSGINQGFRACYYGTAWTYRMTSSRPLATTPSTR